MLGFKVVNYTKVKAEDIRKPGFTGVQVRWLITKEDGAQNFAMKCFEIQPGGRSGPIGRLGTRGFYP